MAVRLKRLAVAGEVRNLERARPVDAVALGDIAALHPGKFERYDRAIEQASARILPIDRLHT